MTVSVVIPVYQGEHTLEPLLEELLELTKEHRTPNGHSFRIEEVILVHDGAIDGSAHTMEEAARRHSFVRTLWLSRNFGQHPATLAGMASTGAPWVVTMDEDGQQNPADIAKLLDTALEDGAQLVYGKPVNRPPHGFLRNALSALAKWIFVHVLGHTNMGFFNSFRLMNGEIARSLAAYCGNSVYLDVALGWVVARVAHCPITLRAEHHHRSGYSLWSLLNHFWRLLLTSGTRPLRLITVLGLFSIVAALCITAYALWIKFIVQAPVQGWASLVSVVSFFSGLILFSLGTIAEYLAVTLTIVMGKPLYMIVSSPEKKHV